MKKLLKKKNSIKLFDSFAGIGALHKALKELNINVELVGMSEIDIEAIRAYSAIHYNNNLEHIEVPSIEEIKEYLTEKHIGYDFKKQKCKLPSNKNKLIELYRICVALNNYGDISLINPNDLPDFDLFNFSFPCTDISIAGKLLGLENTRSGLYVYGMDIIKTKKPKYIMIENVKNLISTRFKPYFDKMLEQLDKIGYNCYWKVLNAKDYGIPQNRERVFVICVRKDVDRGNFKFPKPLNKKIKLKDLLDERVDEKYYIPYDKVIELINQEKDKLKGSLPNSVDEIEVTHALSSREHRHSRWKKVVPTLCMRDYKDPKIISIPFTNSLVQVGELKGGKWDKVYNIVKRVYSIEGLSPTLHCQEGNSIAKILDKLLVRKLTPSEYYRLMGFTNEDIKKVKSIGMSDSQMYKQAGNSIVVNVLKEIFKNLF